MKKRRDLAKKILKFSLMVSLAVSAFFYAPMEVQAADNASLSGSVTTLTFSSVRLARFEVSTSSMSIPYDVNTEYVRLQFDYASTYSFTAAANPLNTTGQLFIGDTGYPLYTFYNNGGEASLGFTKTGTFDYVVPVSSLSSIHGYSLGSLYSETTTGCVTTWNIAMSNITLTPVASVDGDLFQSGYDAGYAAGLSQGESSGYSSGYSDGYAEGESSGYESGYQAGVDSVDTQSYYDSGYSAGYTSGYSAGYETGYDDGYDAAMSRIESWGADTSEYPLLIQSKRFDSFISTASLTFVPSTYELPCYMWAFRNVDLDHEHTYRVSGSLNNYKVSNNGGSTYASYSIVMEVGGREYVLYRSRGSSSNSFDFEVYIPGDMMSSYISLKCVVSGAVGVDSSQDPYLNFTADYCYLYLYDCGSTTGSQNETAKQTDDLTNGFDSSSGDAVASEFSDGVAEYEEVEGSLFTSAKSSLQDYQFFDLQSIPAVITGLSFVTSIMTSIFNSMGGVSGAGIVLSVLFSVMLVSVVSGLYRYYVSSGKSGKHDKKGGGR